MQQTPGTNTTRLSSIDSPRELISANRVEGTKVCDQAGESLGEVKDLMIGKTSGEVAYAIISFGGFLGINEKYHPLPWSALTYDTEKDGYVIPFAKESLKAAPSYTLDELKQNDDDAWRSDVDTHYKSQQWLS